MASLGTLLPAPWLDCFDVNGDPISGGQLTFFLAGTSTPTTTYSDVTLTTPNAVPLLADSAGRAGPIYLSPGTSVKLTLKDAAGVLVRTLDNIASIPSTSGNVDVIGTAGESLGAGKAVYLSDGSGGKTAGQWFLADSANGYASTIPEVGMTIAAITIATTGTIRIAGSVTGLAALTVGTTYYVGTSGALTSTAPLNRRAVGVADTTTSLVVGALNAGWSNPLPVVQTITLTGAQDNVVLTAGATILRCNNATLVTISGFVAGYDGQIIQVESIGAGQVDLLHQQTSTAANRLINFATVGITSLAAGSGTAVFQYDLTTARWRLVAHEQGAWISPGFATGLFVSNAGTWTVDVPGDVVTLAFYLKGRALTVAWFLNTTSTGGGVGSDLNFPIPNSLVSAKAMTTPIQTGDNNVSAVGLGVVAAAGLVIINRLINSAAWTNAVANLTFVRGELTFEVQ